MVLRVEPGVLNELAAEESVHLQVTGAASHAALVAAVPDLWELGGSYVSEPVPTPDGPLVFLELTGVPLADVLTIPDLIGARLAEAGISSATLRLAPSDHALLARVEGLGPAVRGWLRMRPESATPALESWLPDGSARYQYSGAVFVPLRESDSSRLIREVLDAGCDATILAGDLTSSVRALNWSPTVGLQGSLGAAGGDTVEDLLLARTLVRAAAVRLLWAGVCAEPDAHAITGTTWNDRSGSKLVDPYYGIDTLVPDGLWYQVLSEGHLARLGGAPEGSVPLGDGVVELTVGEPEQWVPGHPDLEGVRARARELLGACLGRPA